MQNLQSVHCRTAEPSRPFGSVTQQAEHRIKYSTYPYVQHPHPLIYRLRHQLLESDLSHPALFTNLPCEAFHRSSLPKCCQHSRCHALLLSNRDNPPSSTTTTGRIIILPELVTCVSEAYVRACRCLYLRVLTATRPHHPSSCFCCCCGGLLPPGICTHVCTH